jgi:hypothetical protein
MPARNPSRSLFRLTLCLALLQALSASLPSAGVAQAHASTPAIAAPPATGRHRGWVFSLGAGVGRPDFSCDGCTYDRENGFSAFLSAGRAIRPSTLLSIEAGGWTKTRSSSTLRVYSVMAALTQYLRESGLFASGGLGLIGFDQNANGDISAKGLGVSGQVGYEVGLGRFAIAPHVSYARSLLGARVLGESITISNVQVGVSLVVD